MQDEVWLPTDAEQSKRFQFFPTGVEINCVIDSAPEKALRASKRLENAWLYANIKQNVRWQQSCEKQVVTFVMSV